MKPLERLFLLLLLTAFLKPYKSEAQVFTLTEAQVRNIALAYDSLDECKEASDSLRAQVNNALAVISSDSTVILNLRQIEANQAQIISGKDLLISHEKQVSSSLRRKYIFWQVLSAILAGLNVYQIVR